MAIINQDWYAANEGRGYPLDDVALGLTFDSEALPTDIIADLCIRYPVALGIRAFLASVAVTARLVTLTIESADDLDDPSTFSPLAVVSVVQPVLLRQHVAVLPQVAGVGGWVVFGRGARDRIGYNGRFTPRHGLLSPRAAKTYRPLPVTKIHASEFGALGLTGIVNLRAEPPLYLRKEDRVIEGVSREVIVVGLLSGESGEVFLPEDEAKKEDNVFLKFAGPCEKRPESGTCGEPEPIESVNSVEPDCNGEIIIQFLGCADVSQIVEQCGIVVECGIGVSQTCPADRLPTEAGQLPSDVEGDVGVSYSDSCPE